MTLIAAGADTLNVLTYRNPVSGQPSPTETAPVRSTNEPGFFEAEALLGYGKSSAPSASGSAATGAPKTLVILFDTSLSMQWEKLERSYQALESLLRTLRPADRFNLLLFNNRGPDFQPAPVAADPASVQHALDFVRSSRLRGGTDLQRALQTGLQQCSASGGAQSLSDIAERRRRDPRAHSEWQARQLGTRRAGSSLPETQRPRTYIFAVGDDANLPLLQRAGAAGRLAGARALHRTAEFKLNSFLSKIGRSPIGAIEFGRGPGIGSGHGLPAAGFHLRGLAGFLGGPVPGSRRKTYLHGSRRARRRAVGDVGEGQLAARSSSTMRSLPRLWARARVDALLEKIQREGEDQATIDEIIRLARQYKFVTPYTSFLAVPRALLRPRVIRPGDPVLRVKTDESISSVTALFPFGLVQKLRYLSGEDVWQTRFLAPDDMQDGTYTVRLVLRDRAGPHLS